MYECKYPDLFSPIWLGDTLFRNRCFAAPVAYEYLSSKNYPIDETVFFERKAVGGAATVNIGSAMRRSSGGKNNECPRKLCVGDGGSEGRSQPATKRAKRG
jgi:2,4-dienoyl-CoA reductase-like NADH-dependent reductase (Old Yellow Enzyme family)